MKDNQNSKINILQITLCAVLTALLAVLSQVTVPLPGGVPLTLQTFAVALCGALLGVRLSACSVGVYLLLGVIGVPVFHGFTGGFGIITGPTGGFLIGFLPMAVLCSLAVKRTNVTKVSLFALGLISCHLLGVIQYSLVTGTDFFRAFLLVSLPFLLKDSLSVFAAYMTALAVRKVMPGDLQNAQR